MASRFPKFLSFVLGAAAAISFAGVTPARAADAELLNVSYDPTRELYEELNPLFAEWYQSETGQSVSIEQSHGGSSKQARSVIDGLRADVVTLGLGWDVIAVEKAGLIEPGWQQELPHNSTPYTSSVVFVVRKGNPKNIQDWGDLIQEGVEVITANPKTSGGARWNFLAAWGYAAGLKGQDITELVAAGGEGKEEGKEGEAVAASSKAPGKKNKKNSAKGDPAIINSPEALEYITALYGNVPVLDTGARGSTVTFAQKGTGDVLIAWENEAWLALEEFADQEFEIVYPSVTILAEPPVAVVDKNVDQKGTREAAEAYLKFLFTPEAQDVIAQLHYRPRDPDALSKYSDELPPLKFFTIDDPFGGWEQTQAHFFDEGGVFDQIYAGKSE